MRCSLPSAIVLFRCRLLSGEQPRNILIDRGIALTCLIKIYLVIALSRQWRFPVGRPAYAKGLYAAFDGSITRQDPTKGQESAHVSFTERCQTLFLKTSIGLSRDLWHLPVSMFIDRVQNQSPGSCHQFPGFLWTALGWNQPTYAMLLETLMSVMQRAARNTKTGHCLRLRDQSRFQELHDHTVTRLLIFGVVAHYWQVDHLDGDPLAFSTQTDQIVDFNIAHGLAFSC